MSQIYFQDYNWTYDHNNRNTILFLVGKTKHGVYPTTPSVLFFLNYIKVTMLTSVDFTLVSTMGGLIVFGVAVYMTLEHQCRV